MFGANEIERSHVRQFIALMRQLAIAGNGYVIMSSHPSLTGLASKTGLSGSTQWHNSVRARAWLHGGEANNGDDTDPICASWSSSRATTAGLAETIHAALAERTLRAGVAAKLSRPGRRPCRRQRSVPDAARPLCPQRSEREQETSANNYAPTVFAAEPEAKGKPINKAGVRRRHAPAVRRRADRGRALRPAFTRLPPHRPEGCPMTRLSALSAPLSAPCVRAPPIPPEARHSRRRARWGYGRAQHAKEISTKEETDD